ncbi:hypothetical protein MBLNU459_g3846t1 [Dothideomycetes sp. NU459]
MTDYSKLKVAELKALLKERDIPTSGLSKKQQIIDALEADDAETGVDADDVQPNSTGPGALTGVSQKRALSPPPAMDGPNKQPKVADLKSTTTTTTTTKKKIADAQFASSSSTAHVPVDEGCPLSSYHVYIDSDDGIIYDASLNQTNASNNNNKFYRVQLLEGPSGDHKTWTRWGRVGEHGQSAVLGNGSLEDAVKQFEKKFKDKSGLKWQDRGLDPKPGKYVFVERSYVSDSDSDSDEDKDEDESPTTDGTRECDVYSPPKCTLESPVQSLMELIFNQQYFAAAMDSLNYDANKLPLGKLSKATITRGFQALKNLSELLDDVSLAANYELSGPAATEHLSNLYYSLIPHSFGRNRPPVISDFQGLKKEIELLESLSDLKDADNILKAEKNDGRARLHPLDSRFQGLGLNEMTALTTDSSEFTEIDNYLHKTCGHTHQVKYKVQDIFRIQRQGEREQTGNTNMGSDRRLLWHGSRATNFGGILAQGLRIAPPEAPVSGYMFDKGIYLADMSSKSANYCYPHISGGHALLLLCEAELGKPIQTLQCADYQAGEKAKMLGARSTWGQGTTAPKAWKDASCVHSSLAGVMMPDTTELPGPTDVENASLMYNEYICYDVAQVQLRYLLRVRM